MKYDIEPVHIRFKELKGGNKSIYLESNFEGRRKYEFLKLYIIPEKTPEDKRMNELSMTAAYNIRSQRVAELLKTKDIDCIGRRSGNIKLVDWIEEFKSRKSKRGVRSAERTYNDVIYHVKAYSKNVRLNEVNRHWGNAFLDYMKGIVSDKTNEPLAKNTVKKIIKCLSTAVKGAVAEGLIKTNPIEFVKVDVKGKTAKRDFLTLEELKKLMATDCQNDVVRRTFLLACFTGLRISDLYSLTWEEVVQRDDGLYIEKRMQKTQKMLYMPLNSHAQAQLPERGRPKEKVFDMLSPPACNTILDRWKTAAGIEKHVTYHVGRHTFATLELTAGADLFTTSRLLGHCDVEVTQVYAKIIDHKKVEAMERVDKLFADRLKDGPLWKK